MPIKLEPMNPTPGCPAEDPAAMNAADWGDLCWTLYRWGSTLEDFKYNNIGDPIRENICLEVARVIEDHLDELPDEDRGFWERMVAHWRHSGGFLQAGARRRRS